MAVCNMDNVYQYCLLTHLQNVLFSKLFTLGYSLFVDYCGLVFQLFCLFDI